MARVLRGDVVELSSWAKISQVRTLSVERLGKKLAQLAPEEVDQIIQGLNEIIAG